MYFFNATNKQCITLAHTNIVHTVHENSSHKDQYSTRSNTTGTLTKFRGRCRRVTPKDRPELPARTRSCTSIGSEHFGDVAMIWSALHTFNTSPQIKDKELKELFPIVVISAFGFQDFLDSLANVGTPPSNLIHEIHMALLYPLLRQHINNQIAALKRKDSEATVPKWITSSCASAVRSVEYITCTTHEFSNVFFHFITPSCGITRNAYSNVTIEHRYELRT